MATSHQVAVIFRAGCQLSGVELYENIITEQKSSFFF